MLLIILIIYCLAPIMQAQRDTITFHLYKSIWKGRTDLDPNNSYKNKWKNGDVKQGEKFPGSSTIFVLFTDRWHLVDSIQLSCFQFIIAYYQPYLPKWWGIIAIFIGIKIIYGVLFELFFSKIFIKDEK